MKRAAGALLCVFCLLAGKARAQKPEGYVAVGVDALPNVSGSPVELRARLFADEKLSPFPHLTLRLAGSLDGVLCGCHELIPEMGLIRGSHKPLLQEGYAEIATSYADLRVGYSRVVWGRLDEVQPTDVVNPLDLARFFFERRSEARMSVAMVRGRLFFGERANVDALLLPVFRRGRFDQLDEPTSPFNLERGTATVKGGSRTFHEAAPESVTVALFRREPPVTLRNVQGGARFSATTGRLDWSASVFRGFDGFGTYVPQPAVPVVVQVFPRYTMVGGDFETTKGKWALRGEVARVSGALEGTDGGLGFDRRAGDYHVSGTVTVHHETCDAPRATCGAPTYTATSLVAAADRAFARERYRTRTFGVYNVTERATFVRNITSMEVRDNVTLGGSIPRRQQPRHLYGTHRQQHVPPDGCGAHAHRRWSRDLSGHSPAVGARGA